MTNWATVGIAQLHLSGGDGTDYGLVPNRRQAIIWTNAELIHRRTYAEPGGDFKLNIATLNSNEICNMPAIYAKGGMYQNDLSVYADFNTQNVHSSYTRYLDHFVAFATPPVAPFTNMV